jgi:hydrogenase maturation factor HypF (carbamoyltransferase family)
VLRSCSVSDFARAYVHPQYKQEYTLDQVIALYSWHCDHHYAHIEQLLLRKSWLKK